MLTLADCLGGGAVDTPRSVGVGSVCNPSGNTFTPCGRADFNQNGVRGVEDIFGLLSAWFADSPPADIDSDGRNVQDIFHFLSLWLACC